MNHVGGSRAAGVPDTRRGFQRDAARVLLQHGLLRGGLAVAFRIAKIVPLLHSHHLAVLGIEISQQILTPGLRGSAFGSGRIAARFHLDGAKRADQVALPIGDVDTLAIHLAVARAGVVGKEFQVARSVGGHCIDFPPTGPHLHFDDFAAQQARVGKLLSGGRGDRFRFHQ